MPAQLNAMIVVGIVGEPDTFISEVVNGVDESPFSVGERLPDA